MNVLIVAFICTIVIILSGCSEPPTEPADKVPTYAPPKVDTVAFKSYRISDTEHMVLIDIPDKYVPRRCAVFIDDLTKTSHMNCNFDDAGGALPEDNAE